MMLKQFLTYLPGATLWWTVRKWRNGLAQLCLVALPTLLFFSGLFFSGTAAALQWSHLLRKVSNAPKTIVSLRMQQIHSFNFLLDPTIWQLQDIQSFENKNRYEFSKSFHCISDRCKAQTVLSLTIVTYKYSAKIFTPAQLKKNFPLSKWGNVFKKGSAIAARFKTEISASDSHRQTGYGYRYIDLNIKDTPVNGLIDLLFYSQSQARLIISSPETTQVTLKDMIKDIEDTMSLQLLR